MGRLYLIQLDGPIYSCKHCHSHLANCDELLSKVMPLLLFFPFGLPSVTILILFWFSWFVSETWVDGFWGVGLPKSKHVSCFLDSETFLKL
jgi:hypothetical protein